MDVMAVEGDDTATWDHRQSGKMGKAGSVVLVGKR
jgi:hypothetical protein